jgi:hypothetical protein
MIFWALLIGFLCGFAVGCFAVRSDSDESTNPRATIVTHERYPTWGDSPVAGKIIPRDSNGNPIVY